MPELKSEMDWVEKSGTIQKRIGSLKLLAELNTARVELLHLTEKNWKLALTDSCPVYYKVRKRMKVSWLRTIFHPRLKSCHSLNIYVST